MRYGDIHVHTVITIRILTIIDGLIPTGIHIDCIALDLGGALSINDLSGQFWVLFLDVNWCSYP